MCIRDSFYTPGLTTQGKFQPIPLGPLAEIPLIGPVLFRNPPITYLAIILVFVMHYVLFYTCLLYTSQGEENE